MMKKNEVNDMEEGKVREVKSNIRCKEFDLD
jgi:hypothetical protein